MTRSSAAQSSERSDLLLVCSTGGHLLQLVALREVWVDRSRVWVTFDKSDSRSLLAGERVVYAAGPTNRSFGLVAVRNHLRNVALAWRVVRDVRPRVLVSTGAGLAVPFAWIARAHGSRVVFVESFARVEGPSLGLRLVVPVTDRVYVQWPQLAARMRRARYVGNVFQRFE